MLGHDPFYHATIRRMVISFGTLFKRIHIEREDRDGGGTTHLMRVPLQYSAKDKLLVRTDADPEVQRETAIQLPRMGFELVSMAYDGNRNVGRSRRTWVKNSSEPNELKMQFSSIPYNFEFEVYVAAKNTEDGARIIEQVLPFFTPDWTVSVNIVPEMNIVLDIPIVLNRVSLDDSYGGSFEERRAIIWTLNFTMKGYLYGPVVSKPIIKLAKTKFFVGSPDDRLEPAGTIDTSPGLLANGSPTTSADDTVDWNVIEVDDDYDFVHIYSGEAFGDD